MEKKNTAFKMAAIVAVLCIVIAIFANCTCAVYIQKNNTNSRQHVENPTSTSADSASINLTIPKE